MRKLLLILLLLAGGLANIAFAFNGHLMEDQRRHIGYTYLLVGVGLTILSLILGAVHILHDSEDKLAAKGRAGHGEHFNYSPELRKSLARLKSLSDHLPTDDLGEHYINDYHALLRDIEPEIHQDLSPFRIPQSELRRHVSNIGWEGAHSGWHVTKTEEQFCPLHVFRIAISGALRFIDDSLRQITLNPPRMSRRELENKPEPPRPDPPKLQTSDTPQTPERDDYQPDDKNKEIIRYLYKEGVDRLLRPISQFAGFDIRETELRLSELITHDYVRRPARPTPSNRFPEYRLSEKGIRFAIDNNLRDQQPEPKTETSTTYEPDETAKLILLHISYGNSYESLLLNASNLDSTQVSPSLRLLEQNNYIELHRPTNLAPYYRLTKKGGDYLNKPDYKGISHPSSDAPNPTEERILALLANPYCTPFIDSLSIDLKLHPEILKFHLTELRKRDYVSANSFDEGGAARYELTHKARKFLIDNKLIH